MQLVHLPSRGVHNDVPMTWAGFSNRVTGETWDGGETWDTGETFHEMFHRAPDGKMFHRQTPKRKMFHRGPYGYR